MSLNRVLGAAFALLLLGAAALWCLTHLEIVTVNRVIPPAPFVESDPYYALAHILSPALSVKRYADPSRIDLRQSVLLVAGSADLGVLGEKRLEAWVRGGGRLLVQFTRSAALPPSSFWRPGQLFAGLEPRFGLPPKAKAPAAAGSKAHATAQQDLTVLIDPKVWFPDARPDKDTSVVPFRDRTAVAVRSWGKGLVLVSGEPRFLINANLRDEDNLRFTALLIGNLLADHGEVAWLPAPRTAASGARDRLDAGPILIAAIAAFLILAWMMAPRFGPVLPEPSADTRSLRARFRAEGRFLWRYGAGVWIARRLRAGAVGSPDGVPEQGTASVSSSGGDGGLRGGEEESAAVGGVGAPIRGRRFSPRGLSKELFVAQVAEYVAATTAEKGADEHVRRDAVGR